MQKSAGEGETLAHAARELPDRHGGHTGESDTIEPGGGRRVRVLNAGNACEEVQILRRGEIFIDSDAVAEKPDLTASVLATGRQAEHPYRAALKRRQAGDDAQQ